MHVPLDSTSILKSSDAIRDKNAINVIFIQKQQKNLQNFVIGRISEILQHSHNITIQVFLPF